MTRILLLTIGLVSCQAARLEPSASIESILNKPEYAHAHWGIHVEDLATGEVLRSLHSDRLFAPASNTKLFSVAAALEQFGAEHRFRTLVHRQGQLSDDGNLRGELILRPTGDLTLGGRDNGRDGIAVSHSDHTYANGNPNTRLTRPSPLAGLEQLARSVRDSGVSSVQDVVVDDRLFVHTTSTGSGPNTVTPIVINDNLVDFVIRPTKRGELASVEARPFSMSYLVESRVRTTGPGTYAVRIQSPSPGYFIVTGQIPLRHPPQIEVHEVHDAAANARQLFIEALERAGVDVQAPAGGPNPGHRLPPRSSDFPVIAKIDSAPFAEEAKLILKVSHNLHASALPLLLAVQRGERDLNAGMRVQRGLLRDLGVDVDQVSFGGAAGGARADMTTPRVTVQLLRAVSKRPYFDAFRDALPILGVDGTLFEIATNSPAKGKVQAKTGTYNVYDRLNARRLMTSKALGGYATAESGRQLAFSIVVNNVFLSETVDPVSVGQDLGAISAILQQSY